MTVLTPALLAHLSTTLVRPSAAHLVASIVCTTLGHGNELSTVYRHAVASLPSAPASRSVSPPPHQEINQRRRVVREIKEGLFKSAILIGVPKVIEGLLELNEAVEEGAKDDSFVRKDLMDRLPEDGLRNGERGLEGIYQDDIHAIWKRMDPDLRDVQWMSKAVTYGTFLQPFAGIPFEDSPDILASDPALLSVVTLSAIVPQRTPREILWHIRGAIRKGMPREEVETLLAAIASVCEACGLLEVRKGMPSLEDVELQKEESAYASAAR